MKYWAYLHTNGEIKLKPNPHPNWLSEIFDDADESPFVVRRTGLFDADDHGTAMTKAAKLLEVHND